MRASVSQLHGADANQQQRRKFAHMEGALASEIAAFIRCRALQQP